MIASPKLPSLVATLAACIALCVLGCGGGGSSATTGGGGGGGGGGTPNNQVAVVVDSGPAAAGGVANTPYISVTICAPGTSNCQTIDHVSVDIGSSGFRVVSSVLSSTLASALKQTKDAQSRPYVECLQFADGYSWGPVKLADLKVGGETAANIPIEVIGDPAFAGMAPSDCTSGGPEEDSVASFGANGILGAATFIHDCGSACVSAVQTGTYYVCPSGGTCTGTTISLAQQVSNPVVSFPAPDNNGLLLTLPSVANTGAVTVTGTLVFGVDTESNNMLGSAKVLTVDQVGNFTVLYNSQTLSESFLDSGSNAYFFDDSGITKCTQQGASGFYCPTSILTRSPTIRSTTGVQTTVQVLVQNADQLFTNNLNVFNDLAGPATSPGLQTSSNSFDFGLPFFLGKTVFEVFETGSSAGGMGPFVAF